jgi:hypothetical protein
MTKMGALDQNQLSSCDFHPKLPNCCSASGVAVGIQMEARLQPNITTQILTDKQAYMLTE